MLWLTFVQVARKNPTAPAEVIHLDPPLVQGGIVLVVKGRDHDPVVSLNRVVFGKLELVLFSKIKQSKQGKMKSMVGFAGPRSHKKKESAAFVSFRQRFAPFERMRAFTWRLDVRPREPPGDKPRPVCAEQEGNATSIHTYLGVPSIVSPEPHRSALVGEGSLFGHLRSVNQDGRPPRGRPGSVH